MPRFFPLLLLVFLAACTSGGAEELEPAFGMTTEFLVPGSSSSIMTLITPDGTRTLGTAIQRVDRGRVDGREVLILGLEQIMEQGTMRDSLVVDALSLRPLTYSNIMPGMQTIRTVYDRNGHVGSAIQRGSMEGGVDTLFTSPVLDAASFTSLLPALPLEEGLQLSLPVFHYELGAQEYHVQVAGKETVTTCRGNIEAWMVDVTTPANTTRHWISTGDREMIQVIVELGGGNRFEQRLVCS